MSGHNGSFGFDGCGAGDIAAMAKRISHDRITGPHRRNRKGKPWYVKPTVSGQTTTVSFATESEAQCFIEDFWAAIAEEVTTIRYALDAYEVFMRDEGHTRKGNAPDTLRVTRRRLEAFLPLDEPIAGITPTRAQALYDDYRGKPTRTGRPPSVSTHQNTLRQCRSFFKWAVKKGWLVENPFAEVRCVGKANTHKPQLRVDELRRLYAICLEERTPEALAVMFAAMFGLRSSEILRLTARDIDDSGTLLWVPGTKSEASAGKLRVPAIMQPWLRAAARQPGPLFPNRTIHWVSYHTVRLAKLAGVPRITAHGARGSYASAGTDAGALPEIVAKGLRHASPAVSKRHYIRPETLHAAEHNRRLQSLVDTDSVDSLYPVSTDATSDRVTPGDSWGSHPESPGPDLTH